VVGLVGESGSGKTLTALATMRLLPRQARASGSITFQGRNILSASGRELRQLRGRDIAMVFQDPIGSLHPAWRVGEQIAEGIRTHEDITGADARARAVSLLDQVGLPEPARRAHQYPHELSGGMQQRVMIAMALACHPALLIADEPTTALDVTVQAQIMELLHSLHERLGMAMLFVSHDLALVAGLCSRALVMYAGQIIEQGDIVALFGASQHPYTRALRDATLRPEQKGHPLKAVTGAPPEPGWWPSACRFAPRCPHVRDECLARPVAMEEIGPGQLVRCVRHDQLERRS
jgi:peptide/nickel transport system ATP-binding protein